VLGPNHIDAGLRLVALHGTSESLQFAGEEFDDHMVLKLDFELRLTVGFQEVGSKFLEAKVSRGHTKFTADKTGYTITRSGDWERVLRKAQKSLL
jgi:hypothetical protein